jgi:hypothetical protein
MKNCLCSHRVINITTDGTNLILTVSNSTNVGNNERFKFYFPRCSQRISNVITGAPLPVLVNVNGANVQLIDSYGRAVLSNRIPRRADGQYVVPTTGEPFVRLYYPKC